MNMIVDSKDLKSPAEIFAERRRLDAMFRPAPKPINRFKEVMAERDAKLAEMQRLQREQELEQAKTTQVAVDEQRFLAGKKKYDQHIIDWKIHKATVKASYKTNPIMNFIVNMCMDHGFNPVEVLGPSRIRAVCEFRQQVYCEVNANFEVSRSRLGRIFGRDHSTISHGIAVHRERMGLVDAGD